MEEAPSKRSFPCPSTPVTYTIIPLLGCSLGSETEISAHLLMGMRHASLVNSSDFLLDYDKAGAEGRAEYTAGM